jgi:ABC-type transport system substrate-binding protein
LTLVLGLPRRDSQAGLARELGRELGALGLGLEVRYLKAAEDIRALRVPYLKLVEWTMDFPDPENIILPLYGSQSPANRLGAHYVNPRLDTLLEQSEVEASWERRTALFRQMERLLVEDMPAVPLGTERVRIALLPSVHGAKLPALGFFFLDTKEIWIEKREASGGT